MLAVLASFIALYWTSISALFDGRPPFPLINAFNAVAVYAAMFAGTILFLYAWSESEEEAKQLPKPPTVVAWLSFAVLLTAGVVSVALQADVVEIHPIDLLIPKAREQHNGFLAQARASNSLGGAIAEYERRYRLPPPP